MTIFDIRVIMNLTTLAINNNINVIKVKFESVENMIFFIPVQNIGN